MASGIRSFRGFSVAFQSIPDRGGRLRHGQSLVSDQATRRQIQRMLSNDLRHDSTDASRIERPTTPHPAVVALIFGASCWLLDALLTMFLTGGSIQSALLPTGEALVLRTAVSLAVCAAAAVTSTFLIRELQLRRVEGEPETLPQSESVESFAECAFAVNELGEIVDANDAAAQLFSWPVNMFMPMKIDWLVSEFIPQAGSDVRTFADLVSSEPGSRVHRSVGIIGKALSGRKFVAEMTLLPTMNERSKFIVFVRERLEFGESRNEVFEQRESA